MSFGRRFYPGSLSNLFSNSAPFVSHGNSSSTIPVSYAYMSITSTTAMNPNSSSYKQPPNLSECVVKNPKTLRTISSLGFLHSTFRSLNILRTPPALSQAVRSWSIVSSIDGLFMLHSDFVVNGLQVLMLWNPSIRKTLILPPSPAPLLDAHYVNFGLGFDPLIMDYKFVRVALKENVGVQFVAVYTLGTNSWNATEYQGKLQGYFALDDGKIISFNGVVYALAVGTFTPLQVVSFDFRSELFDSFELPLIGKSPYPHHDALTLVDDGCSLALIGICKDEGSIWVMERLENDIKSSSWIKRGIFSTRSASFKYPDLKLLSSEEEWRDVVEVWKYGDVLQS